MIKINCKKLVVNNNKKLERWIENNRKYIKDNNLNVKK